MTVITAGMVVNAPVNVVFRFLADGVNAPKWHPSIIMAERIEGTSLGPGSTVRYYARIGPLPLIWTTRAAEFEWNKGFHDVLTSVERGPLEWYELKGLFRGVSGRTIVALILNYKLSWGLLGDVIDRVFIMHSVRRHLLIGLERARSIIESEGPSTTII